MVQPSAWRIFRNPTAVLAAVTAVSFASTTLILCLVCAWPHYTRTFVCVLCTDTAEVRYEIAPLNIANHNRLIFNSIPSRLASRVSSVRRGQAHTIQLQCLVYYMYILGMYQAWQPAPVATCTGAVQQLLYSSRSDSRSFRWDLMNIPFENHCGLGFPNNQLLMIYK